MVNSADIQNYLQRLLDKYQQWWKLYRLLDEEHEPFDFRVEVQTEEPIQEDNPTRHDSQKKIIPFPVLDGIDCYVTKEPVLLVGQPGSGKSTALVRFLLKAVEQARLDPQAPIPVLIELRRYKTQFGVLTLIQNSLKRFGLKGADMEELRIAERPFLLLLDGLNELPSKQALTDLRNFREDCSDLGIPMVVTTRELGGDNLGIKRQLEIKSLTPPEIQRFLQTYLPQESKQRLQELSDRLRELGRTPLMLWMLYVVLFKEPQEKIPDSRGELFRRFIQIYERQREEKIYLDEDSRLDGETRRWWTRLLKPLAFEMMQSGRSGEPTDFRLEISKQNAEDICKTFLKAQEVNNYSDLAIRCLNALIDHHLIQFSSEKQEIEFCHQLLQECYAAEWLLLQLPTLSDEQLKYYFLNYLKWTEAIALMLGLPEVTERQAVWLLKLALKTDLMLGAKLAGEVKEDSQKKTIELVNECKLPNGEEVPQRFRVELLGRIRSKKAISYLLQALEAEDEDVYQEATKWLGNLEAKAAIPKLQNKLSTLNSSIQKSCTDKAVTVWMRTVEALGKLSKQHAVSELRNKILQGLDHPFDFFILFKAGALLGQFDDESILPELFAVLEDHPSYICRKNAASVLGQIGNKLAIEKLINALDDQHPSVRKAAITALEQFDTEEALFGLIQALTDQDHSVRTSVAQALVRTKKQAAIPKLRDLLHHSNCDISSIAAVVLGHLGDEEAFSRLQQELGNGNPGTRKVAVEALGKLDSHQAVSELASTLQGDPDYSVRRSAAIALGLLGNEEAIPELLKALRHYYPHELNESVETSVNLNNSKVTVQGMSDEELETLGDENAVQRWLWEHRNLDIRIKTAKALAKLGTEDAVRGLFDGLKRSSAARTRLAAAIALGQLGKEEAIQELLGALRDVDTNTRKEIIVALVKLGNQQIVLELLELLKDNTLDSDIRWSIAIALGQIEGNVTAKYLPDLIKLIPTEIQWQVLWTILSIQEECKFYNYEIAQFTPPPKVQPISSSIASASLHIESLGELTLMSEKSQIIFNQQQATIGVSYAAEGSNQEFTQYNNATEQNVEVVLADFKQFLNDLQQKYPNVTDETAIQVVDAEFTEMKRSQSWRWQNFLSLKRQWNGVRTALLKAGEHYVEETPLGKALIGYFEGVSEGL